MTLQSLAVLNTGLVTSVGLTSASSCAAIRAKVTNPSETRFAGSDGEWIMAHCVPLESPWRGRLRLLKMAALAVEECLANIARSDWPRIPLVLCVAEHDRPGRMDGIDDLLFGEMQIELGSVFSPHSLIIPQGRTSAGIALMHARKLIAGADVPFVLIASTDSLITWPTLRAYEQRGRLLTRTNSNGFMPGEGAAALLVGPPEAGPQLICAGLGFASEPASVLAEQPLLGEGLARAVRAALADAGCEMHELDFRVTDLSGEHYYFKEAALASSRILRARKEKFEIWHPAECIGEAGAMSGLATIVVANAACHNEYAPGPNVLCHSGSDSGQRTATILQFKAR